jgi:SAM-dependent methyltransferase
MTRTGRVLHVGCGGVILPHWFEGMQEVRLDIDPDMKPDIVASMTDMGEIGEYEALFCSHALEHLYPHEVQKALAEFKRVLKPEAHAIIFVPDLEDVRPTEEILLVSPAGPITGLDMIFGHRVQLEGSAVHGASLRVYFRDHASRTRQSWIQPLFDDSIAELQPDGSGNQVKKVVFACPILKKPHDRMIKSLEASIPLIQGGGLG